MAAKSPIPKGLDAEAKAAGVSVEELADALKKLESAGRAAAALEAAKARMGQMTRASKEAASKTSELAKSQKDVAEANKQIKFQPTAMLGDAMGKAGPQAQALAMGIAMWTAALSAAGGAIVAVTSYVVGLVSSLTVLRAQFQALQIGGVAAGNAILGGLSNVAKSLPFAASKTIEWGKALMMVNLQGRDLEGALRMVAAAGTLMGESGSAAALRMVETLARGGFEATALVQKLKMGLPESKAMLAELGLRASDLAAALGVNVTQLKTMRLSARQMSEALQKALAVKAAGPLAAMMLTWPVLVQKLKEGFLSLFERLGPAVKPFMKSIRELFGMFGKGTPATRALQKVVTEAFQAIFKHGTMAVKAISQWVRQNVTAANVASTWKTIKSVITAVVGAVKLAVAIFRVLWPVIKVVAIVFGILFAAILTTAAVLIGVFVAVGAAVLGAIGLIVGAVGWVLGTLEELITGGQSAGKNFSAGLLDGIMSGAGAIIEAVKGIASGALGAFKGVLGIASPSKVMAKMGGFAAEGAAQGLDDGAGRVEGAASKLGTAAIGGVAGGMSAGAKGGSKGGLTITFAEGSIRIDGAGKSALGITEEMLAAVLERIVAAQGLMGAT